MIKDYILPLGTVVTLQKGDITLMIVGRAQLFNDNGVIGYFDYSALAYPQGVVAEQEFAFFNDEDIDEILFEGYRNDQEIEFAESYEENISKVEYQKMTLKD
ncbi:DUF4176 domain-containing protein [Lactococcus lactis]|uniref:DUF4176 domain-containing protein n=2 Tax=Lactococcus lactis TaxID=1358 RepID=A0A552Z043_9LACT|nr:DUF4176 domain-containing protein [Lactococcus lactis]MCT0078121.1 DUF4176 domain-containing protein [Lactococcus lactis subsp. lactis]MCT0442345.1 DUF4176 domain-containing protein [Lactococcus lactis subsp. lactis]MDG4966027.1 DUF4176 domain-containing protein [Lactococcus lactis]TRW72858.1 DUF4176 domain-containing protein [Lactococcus lactis]